MIADAKTKVYGDADPALTYQVSGLKRGDTAGALPDWAQSLGMVMSLILLAPSWGGMINGMMTLSGAWHSGNAKGFEISEYNIEPTLLDAIVFEGQPVLCKFASVVRTTLANLQSTGWPSKTMASSRVGSMLYSLISKPLALPHQRPGSPAPP